MPTANFNGKKSVRRYSTGRNKENGKSFSRINNGMGKGGVREKNMGLPAPYPGQVIDLHRAEIA